ncbi:MAG: hypothetical protein U0350_20685 [Caldilineaceae bacterium]
MHVEVDQSGKIGKTNEDTVLAFSNSKHYAILIPKSVKQQCVRILREQGLPAQELYIRFFAIGLYFLLRRHIQQLNVVLIDMEYPGLEAIIKQRLYNLFRRAGVYLNPSQVAFGFIGKKSEAHRIALATFQRKQPPDLILTVKDILDQF